MASFVDPETGTIEEWNRMALSAKINADDIPNWRQEINGPDKEGYWVPCEQDIEKF